MMVAFTLVVIAVLCLAAIMTLWRMSYNSQMDSFNAHLTEYQRMVYELGQRVSKLENPEK